MTSNDVVTRLRALVRTMRSHRRITDVAAIEALTLGADEIDWWRNASATYREALARIGSGYYTEGGAEQHAKDVIAGMDIISPVETA